MTDQDVLEMMIGAYELGLEYGALKTDLERERIEDWAAYKDEQLKRVHELTKLP